MTGSGVTDGGLFDGESLSVGSESVGSESVGTPRDATPPWDWIPATFAAFDRTMRSTEPGYPCHFGVRGQLDGNNSFTAVDERGVEGFRVADLARTLVLFRHRAWSGPKRQSLVVFVGPPRRVGSRAATAADLAEVGGELAVDTARFWRLLAELSAYDARPWPPDTPSDPHDPAWQWCFAGEPWFTFMCGPAYRARASRNVGPCLTLVFQTRRVFEGLSGTSIAGTWAKERVRAALAAYDSVPVHPHLGVTGSSSRHKWRQYALPDDQSVLPADGCPWSSVTAADVDERDPAAGRIADANAGPGGTR